MDPREPLRVHYLTGAPIFGPDGHPLAGKASTKKGESKGLEHLHYVTYDLDLVGDGDDVHNPCV